MAESTEPLFALWTWSALQWVLSLLHMGLAPSTGHGCPGRYEACIVSLAPSLKPVKEGILTLLSFPFVTKPSIFDSFLYLSFGG